MIQQTFASPEEALAHYGKKGMKWGVRKEDELVGPRSRSVAKPTEVFSQPEAEKKAARRARAKKAAIGVGILTAVAGAGFVAYKLNQSGNLPIASIKKVTPKPTDAVKKVIHEQKDVIHLSRGKHRGQEFFKKGGTPSFFTDWEDAFIKEVRDADASDTFMKLTSGKIAAAFADPEGLKDFSGRPISHQVIVPKSMTAGLNSAEDVKNRFWSKLRDAYLENYEKRPTGFGGIENSGGV